MPEERGWLGDSWAFTKSLGSGAWDAGTGLVEGVGELVKGGYALATDEKARESAWNTTKKLAKAAGDYGEEVWDDPAKAYRDARDGTLAAYNTFEQAKEKAAAEGRSAEFWGDLTGKGLFEVGTIIIPAGLAAKAGKLGKVAKGAKQLENAEDIVSTSKRAKAVVANPVIKAKDDAPKPVTTCLLKDKYANKLNKHYESVEAHRKKYNKKLDESIAKGDTKRQQGGYKAKITESIGEQAAASFMQKTFPDYEMVRGFEAGIGFDQVYFKHNQKGGITDIMIVEAKGPDAKLNKTKTKGFQMSQEWVEKSANNMKKSKNPETRELGKQLVEMITKEPPPEVKGKVIQATKAGGAKEIDFSGIEDFPKSGIYNKVKEKK
jgi:hypothetical protein